MWIVWTALDTLLFTMLPLMDTGKSVIILGKCLSGPVSLYWGLTSKAIVPLGRWSYWLSCLRSSVFLNVVLTHVISWFDPLLIAFCSEVVEALLRNEAFTNIADNKGCYPLHLAAWKGDEHIVKLLIHQGPSHPKLNEQVWCCDCLCFCVFWSALDFPTFIIAENNGMT